MIIDLLSREGAHVLITDAIHIYHYVINSDTPDIVYLLWRPGDPVEASDSRYVRATSTLLIDKYALTSSSEVFIPYATSIETFNYDNDGILQEQDCFGSKTIIHVNQTLYTYMNNNSAVWGNIIGNVIVDQ